MLGILPNLFKVMGACSDVVDLLQTGYTGNSERCL